MPAIARSAHTSSGPETKHDGCGLRLAHGCGMLTLRRWVLDAARGSWHQPTHRVRQQPGRADARRAVRIVLPDGEVRSGRFRKAKVPTVASTGRRLRAGDHKCSVPTLTSARAAPIPRVQGRVLICAAVVPRPSATSYAVRHRGTMRPAPAEVTEEERRRHRSPLNSTVTLPSLPPGVSGQGQSIRHRASPSTPSSPGRGGQRGAIVLEGARGVRSSSASATGPWRTRSTTRPLRRLRRCGRS
jgi:hypothetical protein